MMNQLPREILVIIFSKATFKTLITCRRVCKSWRAALSDPAIPRLFNNFPKCLALHVQPNDTHSSADARFVYLYDHRTLPSPANALLQLPAIPDTQLLGSCNGLLCWCRRDSAGESGLFDLTVYISNPLIGESMTIPMGIDYLRVPERQFRIGFGYVPSKKQYKLVHLVATKKSETLLEGKVQTLGSGTWRRLKCPCPDRVPPDSGVYANGAIHWFGCKYNEIRFFYLETEQFGMLLPAFPNPYIYMDYMIVIRDWLTVWSDRGRHVWTMEQYGTERSWLELKARAFDRNLGLDRILEYERQLLFYSKKKSLILCSMSGNRRLYLQEPECEASLVALPLANIMEALPDFVPTFLSIQCLLNGHSV